MGRLQAARGVMRRLRPVLEWLETRALLDGTGMTAMVEQPTNQPPPAADATDKPAAMKEESPVVLTHTEQTTTLTTSMAQSLDSDHARKSALDAMMLGGDIHHLVAAMNSVLDYETGKSTTSIGLHQVHSSSTPVAGLRGGMTMTMEHRETFSQAAMSPFGHGGDIPPEARVWHKPG